MATVAQCLYCFETLAAKLQRRDPLTLTQVEELWQQYSRDHASTTAGATEVETAHHNDNTSDAKQAIPSEEEPEAVQTLAPQPKRNFPTPSPGPSSSSSSSSTPSAVSNASSIRPDSSLSMSSSRTSLSSAPQHQNMASKLRSRSFDSYPVFVTWNTLRNDGIKRLRGCIGTFDAQPLDDVLKTYALTSAFEDTRFQPIKSSELPSLECGITLLTNFEDAPAPLDWEIGKHGIRIYFTHRNKRYTATYLPDVALEQGWTKHETIANLVSKAGYNYRRSADEWTELDDLHVVRYQGSRVHIPYADWRAWRDWVNDNFRHLAA